MSRPEADVAKLSAIARHMDLIRTGALTPPQIDALVRTGQCGPPHATQLKSWGSACPPGFCLPDNLPVALGRYFAGEREGCRELPYSLLFEASEEGTVTLSDTSIVTMCPTRMIAIASGGTWEITVIQFGTQNQLIGGSAPAEAFAPDAYQMVPMVPDCLRAGQPYTITVARTDGGGPDDPQALNLIFIGPVVG